MEFLLQLRTQVLIAKGEHATICMVDNHDVCGTEQLLGNDEGTKRIGSSTTRVADDVRISFLKAERARRKDSRIHTGKYGYLSCRRHW